MKKIIFMIFLSFFLSVSALFSMDLIVKEFETCRDVAGYEPLEITDSFSADDLRICVYMKLSGVENSLDINWELVNQQGEVGFRYSQNIPSPSNEGYDRWKEYVCWGYVNIEESMIGDLWEIRAIIGGDVVASGRFRVDRAEKREFDFLDASIENLRFKYPSSWYIYYDENDSGYCQVYSYDENGNCIMFVFYISYYELLEDEQVIGNTASNGIEKISGADVNVVETMIYEEEEYKWYKYSIYEFIDYKSNSGKNIFLISAAPEEVYDDHAGEFEFIKNNVELLLF